MSDRVTITDVAKEAGVAIGTVSNYINKTASVSQDKTERIKRAIEILDYYPDTTASTLRRKTSKEIFILTPNLDNPFYTKIISFYMQKANEEGYSTQISGYEYSTEIEKSYLRSYMNSKPGSVVVIFGGHDDEKEIKKLSEKSIKVILADRYSEIKNVSSVSFENDSVIENTINYLIQKGYKKIGLITEDLVSNNIKLRYESFKRFLDKKKNISGQVFIGKDLSLDKLKSGYFYMKNILKDNKKENLPDVWIATSDYLAIGIIKAIRENGYDVPGDFGVVGFDNLDIANFISPELTTISQNQENCGIKLWEATKKNILDNETCHLVLPQELVIRQSC